MRAFVIWVYVFLYTPIALIALSSFNSGRNASELIGFSTHWYGKSLENPFLMEALANSVMIAGISASMAAVFGTMAAIGSARLSTRARSVMDALFGAAIVVPGVVIGIATLVALAQLFAFINPVLATVWPGTDSPRLGLGFGSVIAAHGLFSMALVTMIVKARLSSLGPDLVEASADLYATPSATFVQVVLPQIFSAVVAGFLLAFTFSFDDFIVAFFVAGANTTLPIYIFSSIRRGVTPEVNAVATMVLAVSISLVVAAQMLLRERH